MLHDDTPTVSIDDLRLSASSIKTYKNCPRKFYLSKVAREEPTHPDNIYTWIGTLVHTSVYSSIADYKDGTWKIGDIKSITSVRKFFDILWESDTDVDIIKRLTDDAVIDLTRPNFSTRPVNDPKLVKDDTLTDEEKWKELAWRLVKNGYSLMTEVIMKLDDLISINIEVPLSFTKYGANFVGYIDILVETKNGIAFFDLKTSRKAITQPDKDIQFYLYRSGLKEQFGLSYMPPGYYVHLRSGRLYPANGTDLSVFKSMDSQINSLIGGILDNRFEPNLGSPLCAYCEYRGFCFAGGKVLTPMSVMDLGESILLPETIPDDLPIVEE